MTQHEQIPPAPQAPPVVFLTDLEVELADQQTLELAGARPTTGLLTEKIVARDGLIRILEALEESSGISLDISVHRGFAGAAWRRTLLGLVDIWVNGRLVEAYPVEPGARQYWLTAAQVRSAAAPDIGAFVQLSPANGGRRVELLGWIDLAYLARAGRPEDGFYQVTRSELNAANGLFQRLQQPVAQPRTVNLTPAAADLARLLALLDHEQNAAGGTTATKPALALQPWSATSPEIYDWLVMRRDLAERYASLVEARQPELELTVTSADDLWATADPQPVIEAAESLAAQIAALLRAGGAQNLIAAARLVANRQEPELLLLKATISSLRGNIQAALREARQAYRAAPERALRLFGPSPRPRFALAWQYGARSGLAGLPSLLLVDALDTAKDLSEFSARAQYELLLLNDRLMFSLRVTLPPSYAGYAFRVLVLDKELLASMGLEDRAVLRGNFAYRTDGESSEVQHILIAQGAVLTADDELLGGVVAASGQIRLFEQVVATRPAPDEFFENKQLVLVLFQDEDGPINVPGSIG